MDNNRIGNYIHWSYSNYLKYGLRTKEDGGSAINPEDIFNKQRRNILQEVKSKRNFAEKRALKAELESRLNFFYSTKGGRLGGEDYSPAEIESLRNLLILAIERNIKNGTFDFSTLKGFSTGRLGMVVQKMKDLATNNSNQFNAMKRRFDELLRLRDEIANSNLMGTQEALDWQRDLQTLEAHWNSLKQSLTGLNGANNIQISMIQDNMLRNKYVKGYASLAEEMNDLLHRAKGSINRKITGDVGEFFAVIAIAAGEQFGKNQVFQLLQELAGVSPTGKTRTLESIGLLGNSSSVPIKMVSNLAVTGLNAEQRENLGEYIIKLGSDNISVLPSAKKDKVDASWTLSSGELNASIKNYNLEATTRTGEQVKIELLSGADLINYLQEYGNLLNHYLNVIADPINNEIVQDARKDLKGETWERDMSIRILANQTIALVIAVKALMGGVFKLKDGIVGQSKMAEVFIVHDNSKTSGGWTVYFMDDILMQLETLVDKIFDVIEFSGKNKISPEFKIEMEWQDTIRNYSSAYRRIAFLVAKLQEISLVLELDQSVLTQVSSIY